MRAIAPRLMEERTDRALDLDDRGAHLLLVRDLLGDLVLVLEPLGFVMGEGGGGRD